MAETAAEADFTPRSSRYTLGEEIANSVIHGVGIALSLAGLLVLTVFATLTRDPWKITSSIIYGLTLVLEYTASTLYHSIQHPRGKHVLKIIDHAGIYLFIAGTYTPFCLVTLRGPVGWWLFGTVWALAVAGISMEAFWTYRPRWVSSLVYVAMGWIVVIAIQPLLANLAPGGIWLMVAGGIVYTLGAVIYAFRRVPYLHAVWLVFVLAGSTLHYFAVLLFVVIGSGG
ncbi:MAG: hemolysin III family protein [Coriobacteriales bacterium]|nr:hemolysin III family protein [Coriobacteriales bacterium]